MNHAQEPDRNHFNAVVKAIYDRRVIPFLGAGASICGRPEGARWTFEENNIPPNARELTDHLVARFQYPRREQKELARVSQYAAIKEGSGPLYEELQRIFDKDFRPTKLHEFLAYLPAFYRKKNIPASRVDQARQRLIVFTTNYDDLLERAFDAVGEPYHKLVYIADTAGSAGNVASPGNFLHWTPDGDVYPIDKPNEYRGIEENKGRQDIEEFPAVIVKIHGAVERNPRPDSDDQSASYVITEDHYIDYLARTTEVSTLLPFSIVAALKKSHFLFLGYSLRDWNLRVIWRRIWQHQNRTWKSWAVQVMPGNIDTLYWSKQGVDIFDKSLVEYIRDLRRNMENYHV